MAISVICGCGAKLKAADELAGRQTACPLCKRKVLVPGNRRRMYLFERAYVDYAARFRDFFAVLACVCRRLWQWFWRGPGSTVMEIVLRVAVVVSGIAFGTLYVMYEQRHGRGFSATTVLAFCLVAVYISLLMWGWKTPVHVAARGASGASAAGVVLCLGTVAGATAGVVFLAYLLGLLLLTGLSLVLFVPLRVGQELYLLGRRITYQCPYDDCPTKGRRLPIHVCSCGAEYSDLKPSFYGVLDHTCNHGSKSVKLPTTDFCGRNRLKRLCSGCKRPLIHSSIGDAPLYSIQLVGPSSAGKTVFLRQSVRRLCDFFRSLPGGKAHIDAVEQDRMVREDLKLLDSGQVPDKTGGDVMEALGVAVRMPKRGKLLLHLYDAPGEHYETVEQFARKQVVQRVDGIVLLVDPFSLPRLAAHPSRMIKGLMPAGIEMQTTVSNLIRLLEMMRERDSTGKFSIPVAVVLSKADALPTDDLPFLNNLYAFDGETQDPELLNARCRAALVGLGGANAVNALEQHVSKVRYFACSALGRTPDIRERKPFRPTGVAEPYLWMLGLATATNLALPRGAMASRTPDRLELG